LGLRDVEQDRLTLNEIVANGGRHGMSFLDAVEEAFTDKENTARPEVAEHGLERRACCFPHCFCRPVTRAADCALDVIEEGHRAPKAITSHGGIIGVRQTLLHIREETMLPRASDQIVDASEGELRASLLRRFAVMGFTHDQHWNAE